MFSSVSIDKGLDVKNKSDVKLNSIQLICLSMKIEFINDSFDRKEKEKEMKLTLFIKEFHKYLSFSLVSLH